jgi:hypothetical protein
MLFLHPSPRLYHSLPRSFSTVLPVHTIYPYTLLLSSSPSVISTYTFLPYHSARSICLLVSFSSLPSFLCTACFYILLLSFSSFTIFTHISPFYHSSSRLYHLPLRFSSIVLSVYNIYSHIPRLSLPPARIIRLHPLLSPSSPSITSAYIFLSTTFPVRNICFYVLLPPSFPSVTPTSTFFFHPPLRL